MFVWIDWFGCDCSRFGGDGLVMQPVRVYVLRRDVHFFLNFVPYVVVVVVVVVLSLLTFNVTSARA